MIIDGFQRECIEQAQLNRIDTAKDTVTGTATAKSYNVPAMQGWICPVCGRGVSPYTAVCPCKNGKVQNVQSSALPWQKKEKMKNERLQRHR